MEISKFLFFGKSYDNQNFLFKLIYQCLSRNVVLEYGVQNVLCIIVFRDEKALPATYSE
jgi:hypothetical protein